MRNLAHFNRKFLRLNYIDIISKVGFEDDGEKLLKYLSSNTSLDYQTAIQRRKKLYLYFAFCISVIFAPSLHCN